MTQAHSLRQAASVWFIQLRENPQDESLKAGFDAWLAQAPEHAQAWASINRAAGVMNRMAGETSSVPHALPLPAFRPGWARRRKAGAVLAVGMAACVAGLVFGFDLPLRWQADQYAPAAQMRTVQLADGSSILLAPLSAIRVEASGGGRTITLLRGEALFTVKHDPARPFSVKAGDVTATDIGTVVDVARTAQG
ncbi:MAG: FecR domain-containing protein, partial [Acetobacter papayae]